MYSIILKISIQFSRVTEWANTRSIYRCESTDTSIDKNTYTLKEVNRLIRWSAAIATWNHDLDDESHEKSLFESWNGYLGALMAVSET